MGRTVRPARAIAPAYGDRVMKKGILVGWLKQPEVLRERIQFLLDWKLPQLKALYLSFEFTPNRRRDGRVATGGLCPLARCDLQTSANRLRCCRANGENLLFEAQLGAGRDLVYGEYPWTTSSNVTAAYAGLGSGLPALRPERVIAVAQVIQLVGGDRYP